MAHGLPVIATRHNPLDPDLVHGHLIRLVAPRDVEGLATALIELLADSTTRSRLSDAGRAFVRGFAWDAIAKTHLEVYQSVVERCKTALSC